MKINPPKANVGKDDPFENALYGRKEFGQALTGLLRNVSESLVIIVNAPWGEGKTTFAKMWLAHLKQQKLDVIFFDAYAADYYEDPFVSFSGEILALVDKRLKEGKGLLERREDFKKKAGEVGKSLAGLAVKIGLRAASFGVIESAHIKDLEKIASDIASDVSKVGAEIIEKKIESYVAEKDSMTAFKLSLAELAAKVREEQDFPLTIIVDELDRCRPDFALGLLERIKHLFDVEGVAFVLLVNLEQMENYVRTVYGDKDARAYLLKFANLFVDLPNKQSLYSRDSEKGRAEYCQQLFYHYGFSNKGIEDARPLGVLVNHFALALREIEKVFTIMAIYYAGEQASDDFMIPMLAVLKVKRPLLYQQLSTGSVSVDQFFKETGLGQINNEYLLGLDQAWVRQIMKYCLMSEAELEETSKDTKNVEDKNIMSLGQFRFKDFYTVKRQELIQFFCERLDRFSRDLRS